MEIEGFVYKSIKERGKEGELPAKSCPHEVKQW